MLGPACSRSWVLLAASYVYGTEPGLSDEFQVQTTVSLPGQLQVKSTLSAVLSPKATTSSHPRFPITLSHFSQDPWVWMYFGEIFLFRFGPAFSGDILEFIHLLTAI